MALIALPVLIFGVPALFGHPVLLGDDMTQNYPLRVLVGRDIAAGRPPLFDPYIWSGSALLAGWNAGAAYPLTLLFAIMPGVAAWSVGLVITFMVACLGMFGFLRALRLGSVGSFCGALSFGLAGAMSAQVAHFGLVAGMSWVPLALLAVLRLTGSVSSGSVSGSGLGSGSGSGSDSGSLGAPVSLSLRLAVGLGPRAGWAALLGASTGLMILAGEPRAIVDGYTVVGLYAIWRLARLGWGAVRSSLGTCLCIGGGLALGLALGAVQWLPGMTAISASQRGTNSLALFASGSLPDHWLLLTLVPDLMGGSGSLSQPSFFASYNLTEVTSYVGILPLVAAFALLARVRLRARPPEWLIWHVTAVVGVFLALGANTPLGTVLYRLPLYGGQRLQSRNILVLDLALAVLLAYWADQPFGVRRLQARRVRADTVLGLLPPIGTLVVVVLGLTWGPGLMRWLGDGANPEMAGRNEPWLLPYAVIAVGAAGLVVFGRRLRPRMWRRVFAVFAVADIVVFTVLSVVSVAPAGGGGGGVSAAGRGVSASGGGGASAGGSGVKLAARVSAAAPAAPTAASAAASAAVPSSAPRPISALGYAGRFAIYDPDLLDTADLSVLDPPDLNDLDSDGMASIQGYTSLVDGTYATATGSHDLTGEGQDTLSPAAVANGTLDQLDTTILLTLPTYLTTSGNSGAVAAGPAGTGQRDIGAGKRTTWNLGESVPISQVKVPDADARADAAAGTKIGLTAPDGTAHWFRAKAADAGTLEVTFPAPMVSATVIGRADHAAVTLGAPSVVESSGQVLVADGQLQDALVPPRWEIAGYDGAFAVFADKFASGPLTVQALPGRSAAGASVQYVTGAGGDPVRATVSSADGVRLVRSVAAIPGWTAFWQPVRGTARVLPVRTDGLVQAVDVPAGRGVVTWHYMTPRFFVGLALTLGGALVIALFTLLALAGDRARRRAWAPRPPWNWWQRRGRIEPAMPTIVWDDFEGPALRPVPDDENAQVLPG